MKKFLFTLATLIAAGFSMNAANVVLEVNGPTEYTPDPNTSTTVRVKCSALEGIVAGLQFDYQLFDDKGNVIEDVTTSPVQFNKGASGYFTALGMSKLPGNTFGSSIPEDAVGSYRGLIANPAKNISWTTDYSNVYSDDDIAELEDAGENWQSWFALGNVWSMKLNFGEFPSDMEYVLIKFGYWKFSMQGEAAISGTGMDNMDIKVINKNYNAGPTTTPLTGTVVIGDNNGYEVPVTVDVNGTYDLVVTVAKDGGDAVEVPVTDGKIVLGQTPDYGTYVINATATGNGDYEGTVTAEEKTITIDQLKKDDPTITFTTAEDGTVTINVVGATRYEVKVDGKAYDGMEVAPIYDATQTIEVEAWNEEQGYIAGHATATTTVAEKAYAPAVNPVIEFVAGETGVTINVDPFTSYEVIVNGENKGQINFVEKTWEPQHIVVNAVNEPAHQLKGEATAEYDLAAKANMDLEGTVTFGAVEADGRVYVQYTGTEDVTVAVAVDAARAITTLDGKEGYVQLPTYGTYNLTATVTANHYDDLVVGPVQRVWEAPAYVTPAPGVETQETDDAFIITATGEGTVTLTVTVYDNNGAAHTETVTGQGTATYTVDKTDYVQYVNYSAYAQRDDDAEISEATSESMIQVPALVPAVEKTASPSIVAQNFYKSHHGKIYNAYQVTVTETEANSELQYRVQKDNGTWSDWMSYEDVLVYVETGEYRVEARAKVAEKDWSDPVDVHFFVSEATSIEELFAGKDIANVRYFNVAGQEMQEINGVTIVVTTFTDGTNATVKVMK